MTLPKPPSTQRAIALAAVALTVMAIATALTAEAFRDRQDWVRHTLDVQGRLMGVLSDLQAAESGQRGYLLTGETAYLAPYQGAQRRVDGALAVLADEVADNPQQQKAALALRPLAQAKFTELDRTIALRRSGDAEAALAIVRDDGGRLTMDRLRGDIAVMAAREAALLTQRTGASRRYSGSLFGLFAVMVLGAFGCLVAWLAQARRDAAALRAEAAHREEAEAQVRHLHKMEGIGQLTGGIAHDFNNMLAVIIGNIELARRNIDDKARLEARLTGALEGASRAATLTKRLLAFSRRQPLEPQSIDLNQLVSGMSEMLLRTLGADIRIETVLAGGLWRSLADPAQVESALLNLVVNGRDAMPDGGKLTIETGNAYLDDAYAAAHLDCRAGQYVLVSVTDTGVGMDADTVAKAFEPFFTTKAVGKGTGLGLSQIYGFAKQTGGHARIYSEVGRGTTVKLYLPRDLEADRRAVAPAAAVPAGARDALPEKIILVVEDEDNLRRVSVDSLRELGYTVRHAADGETALRLLQEIGGVDLLFTDIIMPGMNGRQLAEAAAALRPGLKVLYTTGYTRNAVVHNGVLDAGVALLSKPFTVDELAAKVRSTLTQH